MLGTSIAISFMDDWSKEKQKRSTGNVRTNFHRREIYLEYDFGITENERSSIILINMKEINMTQINFESMVAALVKPGDAILASLDAQDCSILHMVVGISGEAGELLDAIKKQVIYRKPLDRENVIEELGDIE